MRTDIIIMFVTSTGVPVAVNFNETRRRQFGWMPATVAIKSVTFLAETVHVAYSQKDLACVKLCLDVVTFKRNPASVFPPLEIFTRSL